MGGGSSDDSSKEITIDDVVKFIHDNTEQSMFYTIPTKYDDIKHISEELSVGYNLVRGTADELYDFSQSATSNISFGKTILNLKDYNIVVIHKETPK